MRDFKKRRYLFALIITAAIFSLGFFFGFLMDIQRVDYFKVINEEQKMNIRSIQLQYDLIDYINTGNQCEAFRFVFDKAIQELELNRERLEIYDQQSSVKKQDFDMLRREYTLSQINFWQISNRLKSSCPNSSDFVTIIYFFSDTSKCPICEKQASVLNYYKAQFNENLLIFAIDETFENKESLITLLKQAYGITDYPTLIIEGNKYQGFIDEVELKKILCNEYMTNLTKDGIC